MTALDFILLAALALSVVVGLWRGLVRSLISLVAWVAAALLAVRWGPVVATSLVGGQFPPQLAPLAGLLLVFLGVVIAGAAFGYFVARLLHAVGLGMADRLLGAAFGLVRGVLLLVVLALIAGLTGLPRHDWWQNSVVASRLAGIVLSLAPHLPPQWAERLDYSAAGGSPGTRGSPATPRSKRI